MSGGTEASNWKQLALQLRTLVVFGNLARGDVLSHLAKLLDCRQGDTEEKVDAYCRFVFALYEKGGDLSEYLLRAALEDDNLYVRKLGMGENVPGVLEECVGNELEVLQRLCWLDCDSLRPGTGYAGPLPRYTNSTVNFALSYRAGIAQIGKTGYGIYAKNTMFCVENGEILPAPSPDHVRVENLIGYEDQRRQVVNNTRALAKGLPAANLLLYGDAGTGKSTTVKAAANLLAPEGVRLIELRKEQLWDIPRVLEQLRRNPLKFIIFLDDLSFLDADDRYNSVKAALEGSASARPANVVIYATSNRRHLVKESFQDREGSDDVHRRDTIQEASSLSERFGLTVMFGTPNKTLYLNIVRGLAEKKGITLSDRELEQRAELFALEKGGRSARVAEQFTNYLLTL